MKYEGIPVHFDIYFYLSATGYTISRSIQCCARRYFENSILKYFSSRCVMWYICAAVVHIFHPLSQLQSYAWGIVGLLQIYSIMHRYLQIQK